MSLASLTGQRIGLEVIHDYGGANKVEITPLLVADHIRAHQKYQERIEKERKEKARTETEIRRENELKRKREAEKESNADFQSKKKKFEDEEAKLRGELKFDEARLTGLENRAENTTLQAEYRSALAAIRQLREGLKTKRNRLDELCCEKSKLVEKYAKKVTKK